MSPEACNQKTSVFETAVCPAFAQLSSLLDGLLTIKCSQGKHPDLVSWKRFNSLAGNVRFLAKKPAT